MSATARTAATVDTNNLQGRWILAQGWLSREILSRAIKRTAPDRDLCAVLLAHGALSAEQVQLVRQAIDRQAQRQRTRRNARPNPEPPSPPLARPSAAKIPAPKNLAETAASPDAQPALRGAALRDFVADSERFQAVSALPGGRSRRFKNYELISELNRGAMGVVYRARDTEDPEAPLLALKFMLATNPNEDEVTRFKREVGVLSRLDHPNIVKVHDFGAEDGVLYFAMELIQGRNLQQIVDDSKRDEGRPPPWDLVAGAIKSVAQALCYCHDQGVIHRDVKPANIIVEEKTNRAVLVDFGLIKKDRDKTGDSLMSQGQSLTQHGQIVGTPAFMSPEQFSPTGRFGNIGPKVDTWGLGATLYYALTGRPPYAERTAIEIFRAIMSYDPRPARDFNATLPHWLDALNDQMLRRSSFMRPNLREVLASLETELAPPEQEPPPSQGSRLPVLIAAALLGIAAIGAIGFLIFGPAPAIRLIGFSKPPRYVTDNAVLIQGQLSAPGARVRIKASSLEESTIADAQGRFSLTLRLLEEKNYDFSMEAELAGYAALSERLEICRDTSPPELLASPQSSADRSEPISLEQSIFSVTLKDSVSGLAEVTLRVDETKTNISPRVDRLSPNGERNLEYFLEDSSIPQKLTLNAKDQADRKAQWQFTVLTPRASKQLLATRQAISDHAHWLSLSEDQRKPCLEQIAALIPELTVATIDKRSYLSHSRLKNLHFALIPGGKLAPRPARVLSPEMGHLLDLLENREQVPAEILADALAARGPKVRRAWALARFFAARPGIAKFWGDSGKSLDLAQIALRLVGGSDRENAAEDTLQTNEALFENWVYEFYCKKLERADCSPPEARSRLAEELAEALDARRPSIPAIELKPFLLAVIELDGDDVKDWDSRQTSQLSGLSDLNDASLRVLEVLLREQSLRPPSVNEWRYAAILGHPDPMPLDPKFIRCLETAPCDSATGLSKPWPALAEEQSNRLGLYRMLGSRAEWCFDADGRQWLVCGGHEMQGSWACRVNSSLSQPIVGRPPRSQLAGVLADSFPKLLGIRPVIDLADILHSGRDRPQND